MKPIAKNFIIVLSSLLFVCILISFSYSNHRELRVLNVQVGGSKHLVEHYLGSGRIGVTPKKCSQCGSEVDNYIYKGNPSLWFGRLEDNLDICYLNNIVCEITRVGL